MFYLARSMQSQSSTVLSAGQRSAIWAQGYAALWIVIGIAGIGYFDSLTSVLLVLSTVLFGIVARYSMRYMAGDLEQPRFMFWLSLTSTFVFALILATNLAVFLTAWCGISLSLHQLLQFYKQRPAAVLAARKKFLVSRLGDVALIATVVLTFREFGTWSFQGIFAAANALQLANGDIPASITWICCLLVFAALLKSAQFPFHSWLPDTMETPTPVSALMHAGIINAGGILVIRLSPLISLSDVAMLLLCLVGGSTALFASTVMLTQSSIKRCLAFSTVAQMGFMMLECGLGAFHLALLHLVAHSVYKAHAFLSSGSAVAHRRQTNSQSYSLALVLTCILAAIALSFLTAQLMHQTAPGSMVVNLIFSLALAQILWTVLGSKSRSWQVALGLIVAASLPAAYFALEGIAELIAKPMNRDANGGGMFIAGLIVLLAVAQSQLPRLIHTRLAQHFYVHARNGFYFNTLANRITATVWPTRLQREGL